MFNVVRTLRRRARCVRFAQPPDKGVELFVAVAIDRRLDGERDRRETLLRFSLTQHYLRQT